SQFDEYATLLQEIFPIGELNALRVLKMSGCRGLEELSDYATSLSLIEDVICAEDTSFLWSYFESYQDEHYRSGGGAVGGSNMVK
ncbi:hypothetical protein Tco_0747120, partial [Tanacetum coccineum]